MANLADFVWPVHVRHYPSGRFAHIDTEWTNMLNTDRVINADLTDGSSFGWASSLAFGSLPGSAPDSLPVNSPGAYASTPPPVSPESPAYGRISTADQLAEKLTGRGETAASPGPHATISLQPSNGVYYGNGASSGRKV